MLEFFEVPLKLGFSSRPVQVEFVVDRVAVGQVFVGVLRISSVTVILPVLHVFITDAV
jgi:hypothetical protein